MQEERRGGSGKNSQAFSLEFSLKGSTPRGQLMYNSSLVDTPECACRNDTVGTHFGAMDPARPEMENPPSKLTLVHS
ncbi:hypothetical protein VNO77_04101 [Canavalia gladiata]|uniref:Uncharacterized protein n=1 Tax=Canavalia gladiata TaxID=3824 RepID=A0AAN9N1L7_CANGL